MFTEKIIIGFYIYNSMQWIFLSTKLWKKVRNIHIKTTYCTAGGFLWLKLRVSYDLNQKIILSFWPFVVWPFVFWPCVVWPFVGESGRVGLPNNTPRQV